MATFQRQFSTPAPPANFFQHGLKQAFFTPAGAFVFACLLGPPILEAIDSTITKEPLSYWSLLTAWPVLLWSSIALALVWYTFHVPSSELANLTKEETWIASWYLINGFFFNSMMDVFAGQFQSWSGMTDYYNALEPRYVHSSKYDGVTVMLTSWQEILIQTPCGLLLFYAYWRNKSWRYPLELIFNGWSVAGVWYFYLSEPVLNFPHVHSPFDSVTGAYDSKISWTFETIWKFWIGFVILPLIWTFFGILLSWRSLKLCSQHIEISELYYQHGKYYRILHPEDQNKVDVANDETHKKAVSALEMAKKPSSRKLKSRAKSTGRGAKEKKNISRRKKK